MAAVFESPTFPLADFLGLTIDVPEPGRSVARLAAGTSQHNPHGVVHGGALFTLVDTGMGAATRSVLEEGELGVTIEVQIRFLRPVLEGDVTGTTRIVHRGRRVLHLDSEVRDAGGRLVATAAGSYAVIRPEAGDPRAGAAGDPETAAGSR